MALKSYRTFLLLTIIATIRLKSFVYNLLIINWFALVYTALILILFNFQSFSFKLAISQVNTV